MKFTSSAITAASRRLRKYERVGSVWKTPESVSPVDEDDALFLKTEYKVVRIHKSYIISLHHIAEVNKSRVVLDNEKDIPIGDSYRERLNDYVNQKFLGK